MGKKKRIVLLVLGIIILGIAIYQYPLQKAFAQKAFKAYIDEQGIDPDNIAIKKLVKDWKQGGYLIVATFNVIVHRFCCLHSRTSQGRGSVRGKPLRVSPLAFNHPPAGDRFCAAKSPLQKRKTPSWVSFFFGAGDEARTRFPASREWHSHSQEPCLTSEFDALRAGRGSEFKPARDIPKRNTTQRVVLFFGATDFAAQNRSPAGG